MYAGWAVGERVVEIAGILGVWKKQKRRIHMVYGVILHFRQEKQSNPSHHPQCRSGWAIDRFFHYILSFSFEIYEKKSFSLKVFPLIASN